MKRTTIASIIVIVILAAGAVAAYVVMTKPGATNQSAQDQTQSTSPQTENQASAPASDITDLTAKTKVDVVMSDLSFKPASIKIKKGTTVTWTNNDTVAHNVVASDPSNAGGLPTSAPTFGHGGTYSMTFNTVGTFNYLCTPHKAFMHGTVQVVE